MKIVFDTNVLISALITTGKPKELFNKAAQGQIQLIISKGILKEFSQVAKDPRIRKYANKDDVIGFLRVLNEKCETLKAC